jgi:deoxyribodipyrimidine photo-lyase
MNPHLTHTEILEQIDLIDPVKYAKTRNHLTGAVTHLSPHITRGVITLPEIRERLLAKYSYDDCEKLIQELAWREYFQKVFTEKVDGIFADLRFTRDDWRHDQLVSGIVDATTGIDTIDEAIRQLYATGYMHNHARMWTAMLACNMAKANWTTMSRWMFYHLIDGDLASNTLSWQWVAGASINKQYVANQELIDACSPHSQRDTYLAVPRADVGTAPLPTELEPSQPFDLQTEYPTSALIPELAGKNVFLYHPWSINAPWRAEEVGERIFVIEPRLFDKHPVSNRVLEHMLAVVQTQVPSANVYVGNVETLPGITQATVYSQTHPTTTHYPGTHDAVSELFPEVHGYYPSFFKFWEAVNKNT